MRNGGESPRFAIYSLRPSAFLSEAIGKRYVGAALVVEKLAQYYARFFDELAAAMLCGRGGAGFRNEPDRKWCRV
jgi:hypothetical protein